jgi:hypothetical protein
MIENLCVWLRDHWNRTLQFAEIHDKAIVAVGTALLAIFSIVLAVATVFLWRATRDLVHDAQDKGERQLRAYVSLVGGAMIHANVDNAPGYQVQIELKNGGKTPGYQFTTWIMPPEIRDIADLPFTKPRPESDRPGKSIIAPGTSAWINGFYQWKPGELEAVRKQEKGVFIWGGANYRDAFGATRMFYFRIMIKGAENAGNGTGWALAPHNLGYDAD